MFFVESHMVKANWAEAEIFVYYIFLNRQLSIIAHRNSSSLEKPLSLEVI